MNDSPNKEIIVYESKDGEVSFHVNVFEETVWLNQQQMAHLFEKARSTISEHIQNIFDEEELEEKVVCRFFRHTTSHGAITEAIQEKEVKYYNLDMIISVGYRVKSKRGVQFRQWATRVLKQYMVNGYAVNEKRVNEIKSAIDELVASQKILKKDVNRIEGLLVKLIERPIVINSHAHHQIHNRVVLNQQLEKKVIELLDKVVEGVKGSSGKIENQIIEVRQSAETISTNPKSKKRLIKFFKDIGDSNSDTYKAIEGAKVAKNLLAELIKIGRNFF